jgi:hypothetical protein
MFITTRSSGDRAVQGGRKAACLRNHSELYFYVSYDSDPEPLTTKMKFKLALKLSNDPEYQDSPLQAAYRCKILHLDNSWGST